MFTSERERTTGGIPQSYTLSEFVGRPFEMESGCQRRKSRQGSHGGHVEKLFPTE
jgi:hypothetical protein